MLNQTHNLKNAKQCLQKRENYPDTRNKKETKKQRSKQPCLCLILFKMTLGVSSRNAEGFVSVDAALGPRLHLGGTEISA